MKNKLLNLIFIGYFVAVFFGCGKKIATVTIVDEKSALEKQILGQFGDFGKEVYYMSSVRSVDTDGKLKKNENLPEDKKKVISAMQRISFNSDDIGDFKSKRYVGENNKGLLEIFNDKIMELDVKRKNFLIEIVNQENRDRKTIMERILNTNINLKDNDMSKVENIYASMKRDTANAGEYIQLPDGNWTIKK
ncbi:MAG TPA: DUF1318 domain-containing protein [bacterium]|nr:DUF1318 domain-containing protein [bacterium]HPN29924.1 DUF1318 domain-containing protein [bacterium]